MSTRAASDILRALLEEINSEAELHYLSDRSDVPSGKYNGTWQKPTYAIMDVEGDFIGFGMSADEAISDAVLNLYRQETNAAERYRRVIRNYSRAMDDLDRLGGRSLKRDEEFED